MWDDSEEKHCDSTASAVAALQTYITQHDGAIVMAGPPTLQASLSNFYKQEHAASTVIKTWESGDNKVGIHSFVVDHSTIFKIVGKGNDKTICLVGKPNTTRPSTTLQTKQKALAKDKALAEIRVCIHSMQVMLAQLSERLEKLAES